MNLILQDTATEIIDIASIEHTQGVEQADYNEKAAHYAKRLGQVKAVNRKDDISLTILTINIPPGRSSTGSKTFKSTPTHG